MNEYHNQASVRLQRLSEGKSIVWGDDDTRERIVTMYAGTIGSHDALLLQLGTHGSYREDDAIKNTIHENYTTLRSSVSDMIGEDQMQQIFGTNEAWMALKHI
jgi:hypothetical protein